MELVSVGQAAIIESSDDKGIIWPKEVALFKVGLSMRIGKNLSTEYAENLK